MVYQSNLDLIITLHFYLKNFKPMENIYLKIIVQKVCQWGKIMPWLKWEVQKNCPKNFNSNTASITVIYWAPVNNGCAGIPLGIYVDSFISTSLHSHPINTIIGLISQMRKLRQCDITSSSGPGKTVHSRKPEQRDRAHDWSTAMEKFGEINIQKWRHQSLSKKTGIILADGRILATWL